MFWPKFNKEVTRSQRRQEDTHVFLVQKYFAIKTLKILLLLLKIEVIILNIVGTCYFVLLIDNSNAE